MKYVIVCIPNTTGLSRCILSAGEFDYKEDAVVKAKQTAEKDLRFDYYVVPLGTKVCGKIEVSVEEIS